MYLSKLIRRFLNVVDAAEQWNFPVIAANLLSAAVDLPEDLASRH